MKKLFQFSILVVAVMLFNGCAELNQALEESVSKPDCRSEGINACAMLCEQNVSENFCLYTSCMYLQAGNEAKAREYRTRICDFSSVADKYGGKISCILNQNEQFKNTIPDCNKYLDKE